MAYDDGTSGSHVKGSSRSPCSRLTFGDQSCLECFVRSLIMPLDLAPIKYKIAIFMRALEPIFGQSFLMKSSRSTSRSIVYE